jgi:hypothetical protein
MALSFCSNWGSLELDHHNLNLNPDMMSSFESELGAGDFLNFDYNLGLNSVLPEYSESLYVDSYNTNSLPYFSAPSDTLTSFGHSPEMFSLDELHESYQYPKRQRSSCAGNYFYSDFTPGFYDGYVPNPGLVPESMSMPELPLPPFPVSAANYGLGSTPEIEKKPMKLGLSAQSIAARERRRKITEKTQELGKLIPGGNKLNTAEMFHAASNYIKFLQAQAALLQLMPSIQVPFYSYLLIKFIFSFFECFFFFLTL